MLAKLKIFPIILLILAVAPPSLYGAEEGAVLKGIRFGKNRGILRMVVDFEGRPSYIVAGAGEEQKSVTIALPTLKSDPVSTHAASTGYPGWISDVTLNTNSGNPILKVNLAENVYLLHHKMLYRPYRIYMDFSKRGRPKQKSQRVERSHRKKPLVQLQREKDVGKKVQPAKDVNTKVAEVRMDDRNKMSVHDVGDAGQAKNENTLSSGDMAWTYTDRELEGSVETALTYIDQGLDESAGMAWAYMGREPDESAGEDIPSAWPKDQESESFTTRALASTVGAAYASESSPVSENTEVQEYGKKSDVTETTVPVSQRKNSIRGEITPVQKFQLEGLKKGALLNRAKELFRKKDFLSALTFLDQFLEAYPNNEYMEESLYLRGDCLYELRAQLDSTEKQEIISAYDLALSEYPKSKHAARATSHMGLVYLDLAFYYEALTQFKYINSKFPHSEEARSAQFWMGEVMYRMGKYREALPLLEQFANTQPQNPLLKRATVRLGECYSRLNRHEDADRIFTEALKKWPDLLTELPMDSLLTVARHMGRQGRIDRAEEILLMAVNIYPEHEKASQVLWRLARLYDSQGKHSRAGAVYYFLMNNHPQSKEAEKSKMALADLGVKRIPLDMSIDEDKIDPYRWPVKTYAELAEGAPADIRQDALYRLAQTYAKRNMFQNSLKSYKRLIMDYPDSKFRKEVHEQAPLVMQRYLEGADPYINGYEAVELYETLFVSAGFELNNASSMLNLAQCYARLDLLDESLKLTETALAHSNGKSKLKLSILEFGSRLYMQTGRLDNAVAWLNQLIRETPEKELNGDTLLALARCRYEQKKYTEAAAAYLKLLPSSDKVHSEAAAQAAYELGRLYMEMGFPANAVHFLHRAARLYPEDKSAEQYKAFTAKCNLLLADGLFEQSSFKPARDHYLRSLEMKLIPEDEAWALYRLALTEEKLGSSDKKVEALTKLRMIKDKSVWAIVGEVVMEQAILNDRSAKAL